MGSFSHTLNHFENSNFVIIQGAALQPTPPGPPAGARDSLSVVGASPPPKQSYDATRYAMPSNLPDVCSGVVTWLF